MRGIIGVSVLCVVSVAACTTPDTTIDTVFDPCQPLGLVVDGDASAEEHANIANAIELWNLAAGTQLTAEPAADTPTIPVRFEVASTIFHGIYLDEVGEIVINRALDNALAQTITIAHETGHAFGLEHAESPAALMTSGNLEIGVTDSDLTELAALWGSCP